LDLHLGVLIELSKFVLLNGICCWPTEFQLS
jgi:hypothetical protein